MCFCCFLIRFNFSGTSSFPRLAERVYLTPGHGSDLNPGCHRYVVWTSASWVTRTPPAYISCLYPVINSRWPLSLLTPRAAIFVSALIFFFFSFLPHVLPWAVLLFSVKWGHGHTWMYCDKLAQRRQMVMGRRLVVMPFAAATWIDLRAAEQPHMLHLCNPDFGYPVRTHPHTPAISDTHATLHQPSVPISINDVCSRGVR